jgi:hypothetical protein
VSFDQKNKATVRDSLALLLESRRDVFTIGCAFFLETDLDSSFLRPGPGRPPIKNVSAGALRTILEWAREDWSISLEEWCAAAFWGRAWEGETVFDLIPEVEQKLSADNLGFGHLYMTEKP